MECPFYHGLLKKYKDKKYYIKPCMFKFVNLMKSEEYIIILNICKFVKYAFEKRTANQTS